MGALDFRTSHQNKRYGVRASAIIVKNNHLLCVEYQGLYLMIGGAVRVGETTRDAVKREVFEETGQMIEPDALAYVVENFFEDNGIDYHNMEYHYLVNIETEIPYIMEDNQQYSTKWIPIEKLSEYPIRPKFLKDYLPKYNGTLEHIINKGD